MGEERRLLLPVTCGDDACLDGVVDGRVIWASDGDGPFEEDAGSEEAAVATSSEHDRSLFLHGAVAVRTFSVPGGHESACLRIPSLERKAVAAEALRKAMGTIHAEWKAKSGRPTSEKEIGLGFVPAGATLTTEPKAEARVESGVVIVDGTVPSESARKFVEDAVRQIKPRDVKNNLEVKP